MPSGRYLHFENLDVDQPIISAQCSNCGMEFVGKVKPGERIDDVLMRMRAAYKDHTCDPIH